MIFRMQNGNVRKSNGSKMAGIVKLQKEKTLENEAKYTHSIVVSKNRDRIITWKVQEIWYYFGRESTVTDLHE
jgi:hypothetical protein